MCTVHSSVLVCEEVVQWDIIKDEMDLLCVCQAQNLFHPFPSLVI